mmetsp:Transcript_76576/g.175563  ORF Transcript_76576/g.175563 Transcript_76576/m.175563 type:complete len:357 (-) Transcript_76576:107-1177(-)
MATDRRPVGVRQSYPELQPSFGPTCGCGPGSLRQILQRPQLYDDKYHAQEWSLLHKIYVLLGGDMTSAGVIDIGAGNGSLALLVSALFGIPTTMVDRRCPRKELRAELFVPESLGQLLQRVTCDCADLDTDAVLAALQARGVRRVVVVAKHLCGLGTDLALRWMEALSQRQEVELVGCVVATCCVHKIAKADFANFVEWYRPAYEGSGTLAGRSLESLLSICCRFATWRTTANSATAVTTEDQVRLAEAFEDVIQHPRLMLLQTLFPVSIEVKFVHPDHTLQDRCLVAGFGSSLAGSSSANSGEDIRRFQSFVNGEDDAGFGELVERRIAELGSPLEVMPPNIVSNRFQYDGTAVA